LKDKKKIYKKNKDVISVNTKPEFTKSLDIIINNKFNKNTDYFKLELLDKIAVIINRKI